MLAGSSTKQDGDLQLAVCVGLQIFHFHFTNLYLFLPLAN